MDRHIPLNVLFVVPYAPSRIRTRPFHLVRALGALGHRVGVATVWSDAEEQSAVEADRCAGVRTVASAHLPRTRKVWNCARALATSEPMQSRYSWSPALARQLRRVVSDGAFDVAHVEHLRGARYGLLLADGPATAGHRRVPVVWDSVDCISSLFRRAARESAAWRVRLAAWLELGRTERYEGRVTPRFDRVLVTSETDRRDLQALVPRACPSVPAGRIDVVPNGVDLDYFAPTGEPRDPTTLVMTGKMAYHANATAAVRFVGEVLPLVRAELPGVRLLIVGKDPPPEVRRLDRAGVVVTGTVEDVRPFLRQAAVAVAPIHYGVGIQNKVLEALACGTPVVATPQAVSALGVQPGRDLLVGREPGELASAIVALVSDPERRGCVGAAGRAYVERHHCWRRVADDLSGVYRDVIG